MSLRYLENRWTAQSFGPTTLGVITSQEADQDPPLVILTHIYIIRQLTTDRNRLSPHWYISWLAIAYSKLLKGLAAMTFNSWGRQHRLWVCEGKNQEFILVYNPGLLAAGSRPRTY